MREDPATKKYDAKNFAKALRVLAEREMECGDAYFAMKYKEMAEWFENIPEEFRGCKFKLADYELEPECSPDDFDCPIVEVYRDEKYICSLRFCSSEPQYYEVKEW